MQRCHYINDKEVGKILIPGCIGVAAHYDSKHPMWYCTCYPDKTKQKEETDRKDRTINELEKENARLWRIIRKLHKKGIKLNV